MTLSVKAFTLKPNLRDLSQINSRIHCIRLSEDLKWNPLYSPVPGDHARDKWIQLMWESFTQGFDLLSGSKGEGYALFRRLFEKTQTPSVEDALKFVERELRRCSPYSRAALFCERIKGRLAYLLSIFHNVFDCSVGWNGDMEVFIRENIVFEAQNLDSKAANIFVMNILLSDYFWRISHPNKSRNMPEVIVLDDAELFLNPQEEKKYNSGIPFVNIMVSKSKEYGMYFIVANQTCRLSHGIKDNAHTWVAFTAGSAYDTREIGARMGLDVNQQAVLYELGIGRCVVKRIGRRPIIVYVDDYGNRANITDEELAEHNREFLERMNSCVEARSPLTADEGSRRKSLSLDEELYLKNVDDHSLLSRKDRTEMLGWSTNKFQKITDRLHIRGYIDTERITRDGHSCIVVGLTNKGIRYLKSKNVRVKRVGRGGPAHYFWVCTLDNCFKGLGFQTKVEAEVGNAVYADLLLIKHDQRIATEIVASDNDRRTVTKIGKLQSLVDMTIVVFTKKELRQRIQKECEESLQTGTGNVKFHMVQDFC